MLENNSNTQFIVMTMSDYMNMVHEAARKAPQRLAMLI